MTQALTKSILRPSRYFLHYKKTKFSPSARIHRENFCKKKNEARYLDPKTSRKVSTILIIIFFICMNSCIPNNKNDNNQIANNEENSIIFWKYNENIKFEDLNFFNINEKPSIFEKNIEIPLNYFSNYYWDEQIFCMPCNIYNENNYDDELKMLFFDSDKISIYFSIVVDNKVIMHGVNRTMPQGAQRLTYYESIYPKMQMDENNNHVYFRLVTKITIFSIWDNEENISILFKDELYDFFNKQNKIIHGKIDVPKIIHGINFINHELFK